MTFASQGAAGPPALWACMSHRPGMRYLPVPLITLVLWDEAIIACFAMESMRPFLITTVRFGDTSPWRVSIILTLVMTRTSPGSSLRVTPAKRANRVISRRNFIGCLPGKAVRLTSGKGSVKQIQHIELLFRGQKRRFKGVSGQLAQMLIGEFEMVLGQLIFT